MKRVSLVLLFLSSILLVGCFHKKEKPPVVVPVVIDTQDDDVPVVDDNQQKDEDPSQPRDEFDEDGEFDPTKFQDDDIDEVMQLLKDLTAE